MSDERDLVRDWHRFCNPQNVTDYGLSFDLDDMRRLRDDHGVVIPRWIANLVDQKLHGDDPFLQRERDLIVRKAGRFDEIRFMVNRLIQSGRAVPPWLHELVEGIAE